MGIFGWSLPPGVTMRDLDPEPQPCAVCGRLDAECICPECGQCGAQGDPRCYPAHGMTRTDEQIASLAAAEEEWRKDDAAVRDAVEDMIDQDREFDHWEGFDDE